MLDRQTAIGKTFSSLADDVGIAKRHNERH